MRDATSEKIDALEARRRQAMVAADVAALGELLHDDLIYIHSNGSVDTKASYLDAITSGATDYRSVVTSGETLIDYGSAVIVTGVANIDVVLNGAERHIAARYICAYVRSGDSWQFASWQSTPVPDYSAAFEEWSDEDAALWDTTAGDA